MDERDGWLRNQSKLCWLCYLDDQSTNHSLLDVLSFQIFILGQKTARSKNNNIYYYHRLFFWENENNFEIGGSQSSVLIWPSSLVKVSSVAAISENTWKRLRVEREDMIFMIIHLPLTLCRFSISKYWVFLLKEYLKCMECFKNTYIKIITKCTKIYQYNY